MLRLDKTKALASKQNSIKISTEPITTSIPIKDAQTLSDTLTEFKVAVE